VNLRVLVFELLFDRIALHEPEKHGTDDPDAQHSQSQFDFNRLSE
jgi:hypothetical protein